MELPADIWGALLERQSVARLATLGPAGRPHLVPVVFVCHGGDLWTPIDGKPKSDGELARVRNVRENAEVTLLLDHYDADWNRLWWLRVYGRAEVVEGRDPQNDPEIREVVEALRTKYPQYGEVPLFRAEPQLLRITVERVRSWCAGPEAYA
jgi:PPOX class probable F420-dependent enzyme